MCFLDVFLGMCDGDRVFSCPWKYFSCLKRTLYSVTPTPLRDHVRARAGLRPKSPTVTNHQWGSHVEFGVFDTEEIRTCLDLLEIP